MNMRIHDIPPGRRSRMHLLRELDTHNYHWNKDDLKDCLLIWLGGTISSISLKDSGVEYREQVTPHYFAQKLIESSRFGDYRNHPKKRLVFAEMALTRSERVLSCFSEDMTLEQLNRLALESIKRAVFQIDPSGKKVVFVMAGSDKLKAVAQAADQDVELKQNMQELGVNVVFLYSMDDIGHKQSDAWNVIDRAVNVPKILESNNKAPNIYVQSLGMKGVPNEHLISLIPARELEILPWNGIKPAYASQYDIYYKQLVKERDEKIERLTVEFNEKIGKPIDRKRVEFLDVTNIVPHYNEFLDRLKENAGNVDAVVLQLCHSASVCGVGDASVPKLIKEIQALGIQNIYRAPINGQPTTLDYPSCHLAVDAGLRPIGMFPEVLIQKLLRLLPLHQDPNILATEMYRSILDEISVAIAI